MTSELRPATTHLTPETPAMNPTDSRILRAISEAIAGLDAAVDAINTDPRGQDIHADTLAELQRHTRELDDLQGAYGTLAGAATKRTGPSPEARAAATRTIADAMSRLTGKLWVPAPPDAPDDAAHHNH